ncbi:MAG TPA: hypothetical protein VGC80_12580, partial [Acetobacteraceae bacterium]
MPKPAAFRLAFLARMSIARRMHLAALAAVLTPCAVLGAQYATEHRLAIGQVLIAGIGGLLV